MKRVKKGLSVLVLTALILTLGIMSNVHSEKGEVVAEGVWSCGHSWVVVHEEANLYKMLTPAHQWEFSITIIIAENGTATITAVNGEATTFTSGPPYVTWLIVNTGVVCEEDSPGHKMCSGITKHYLKGKHVVQ